MDLWGNCLILVIVEFANKLSYCRICKQAQYKLMDQYQLHVNLFKVRDHVYVYWRRLGGQQVSRQIYLQFFFISGYKV